MADGKFKRALGLMSGTSMDGIDAAIVETDGARIANLGVSIFLPYSDDWRARLRGAVARRAADAELVDGLTRLHAEAVRRCLDEASAGAVDIIGFHGQTILHEPAKGITVQIGDGALLATLTGCPVVSDFRSADMAAGGEAVNVMDQDLASAWIDRVIDPNAAFGPPRVGAAPAVAAPRATP